MRQFFSSISKWRIPSRGEIAIAMRGLTKREWLVFVSLVFILGVLTLILLIKINDEFMVKIPEAGGMARIGIVGTPRFINPVLAISDADQALTDQVYSGLMRKDASGDLIPDLAQSYTISPDGLTYTFILKNNLVFQDGKPLTSDDIAFTIQKIQDPAINSPEFPEFSGANVTTPDAKTVVIQLKQPFIPFLQNMTTGILPKHLWQPISDNAFALSNLNMKAIGSGPFMISHIASGSDGTPTNITLTAFKRFALGRPLLDTLSFSMYANETDLVEAEQNGSVDMIANISASDALNLQTNGFTIVHTPLPRVFSLFFNQTQAPIFTDRNVLTAANLAIDKNQIVQEVLSGFGRATDSPLPYTLSSDNGKAQAANVAAAKALLTKAGYVAGSDGVLTKKTKTGTVRLAFAISTSDAPELRKTAELIQADLQAIGMSVDLKVYDVGVLNQEIIQPRDYDALLFGQIINSPADLYSFWDSGERSNPGLNVALYANATVDTILQSAPKQTDPAKATAMYAQLESILETDAPVVFLYEPDAVYVLDHKIQHFINPNALAPNDAYEWFVKTDNVWKPFAKNKTIIN